ncbi:MAG: hypothetical protein K2Y37_21960 [Pirellulales bacterium]|nr:hypothetical protein [Pirellulales bacterium]
MSQPPQAPPVRVIKVGGSLLDEPRLPVLLRDWLARQPIAGNVVLVGGGSLVDAIRQLDQIHQFGEERSHWLAVRAMRVTARLVRELLPSAEIVEQFESLVGRLDMREPPRPTIFDVWQFLREVEPYVAGDRLPRTWQATSDSIAARLACALARRGLPLAELVLLKSTLPPRDATLPDSTAAGIVDACFLQQAASMPRVRLVNLRSDSFDEQIWPVR